MANDRFCLFRVERLTAAGISKAVHHNLREYTPDWADAERSPDNIVDGAQDRREVYEKIDERVSVVDRKVQHNAVKAVELFVGYSQGALSDSDGVNYLKDCKTWLQAKYGPENVISSVIHLDEQVPHLHMIVTPIRKTDKGYSLSARALFSGKELLSGLQSEIFEKVGREYGLERGIEGSKTVHRKLSAYRKELKKTPPDFNVQTPPVSLSAGKLKEWAEKETERLKQLFLRASAKVGNTINKLKKELKALREENKHLKEQAKNTPKLEQEVLNLRSENASLRSAQRDIDREVDHRVSAKERKFQALLDDAVKREAKVLEILAFADEKEFPAFRESALSLLKERGQTKPKILDKQHWAKKYRSTGIDQGFSR